MIAVCLLTCGREHLTERTVETFAAHNKGRQDLVRLHADCSSGTPTLIGDYNTNVILANDGGFGTIHAPAERVPQMVSFRQLIEEAALRGAEFVLWLENDWESVAPIPELDWLRNFRDLDSIVTWRMFGARKMRENGPRAMAGEHRIGTKDKVDWRETPGSGWEFGLTHWAAGGSIATLAHLKSQIHRWRLKDVITAKNDLRTMRPVKNLMFHIGDETTDGFQG